MKDRTRLVLMKIFGAILVAGIAIFLGYVFIFEISEETSLATLFWLLAPAVLVIAVLILMLKRMSRGVKSGLPLEDEMSQRFKERAGYLTLMISIWFLIALMWYHMFMEEFGFPVILARHIIVIVLIFMLAVFGLLWFMLSRRGIK